MEKYDDLIQPLLAGTRAHVRRANLDYEGADAEEMIQNSWVPRFLESAARARPRLTSFLDGFAMAGLFRRLPVPGSPTQVFEDDYDVATATETVAAQIAEKIAEQTAEWALSLFQERVVWRGVDYIRAGEEVFRIVKVRDHERTRLSLQRVDDSVASEVVKQDFASHSHSAQAHG
jgi:hypothetical protein